MSWTIAIGCGGPSSIGETGASAGSAGAGASAGTGGMGTGGTADPAVETKLPDLPELYNAKARVHGDGVTVEVTPFEGAKDYRIYPLPADKDITVGKGGEITIKDAVYRCAGRREAPYMLVDFDVNDNSAGGSTFVVGDVEGFTRAEADAELGYVYLTGGADRAAVYSLGVSDLGSDTNCERARFNATRQKVYTTDEATRSDLIAQHYRDDGIAFYVPKDAGTGTKPLYAAESMNVRSLYFVDGPEADARKDLSPKTAFPILAKAGGPDTAPLMRVFYRPYCSGFHDELVATKSAFDAARMQADQPTPFVRWAGLTDKTVLVVEALDKGCPYQGHLSPVSAPAFSDSNIDYPAFLSLDEIRAASPTGEVFVNGQDDDPALPRAIARTFVTVTPTAAPNWAFFAGFEPGTKLEPFTDQGGEMWVNKHLANATYDLTSYANSSYQIDTMLGELWATYTDVGADVNGKIRLTPRTAAKLSADSFLHVTMDVDVLSTARRYPQILISDQQVPVQENLEKGTTLVIQPKDRSPSWIQVQICDHRTWDVNDQCPRLPTFSPDFEPNVAVPGEMVGNDRSVRFDAYVSTKRVYLLLDEQPYSCIDLPAVAETGDSLGMPEGAATVTFGDVLYHSGVDFDYSGDDSYVFHRKHLQVIARRHFDNLGFEIGAAAPNWNEAIHPCAGKAP